MTERVASCAARKVAAPGKVPDLVHLLPAGPILGRDGRRFALRDAAAVIARSMQGAELPIDYEHQSEDRARVGPVPAAGWITDLMARADGIWGRVVWTTRARELIADREYRYLSPVFAYDAETKAVMRLKGAGLVHTPNLELTALARQEATMSDLARIATALGLEEEADTDAILTAIASRQDTPDPARFVPIEAVRELMAERREQRALMSEQEAAHKVEAAVDSGHITPGMRDWATALCRQDPASFDAFLTATPPIAGHLFKSSHHTFRNQPGATAATGPEAEAICAQLGLSPEELGT